MRQRSRPGPAGVRSVRLLIGLIVTGAVVVSLPGVGAAVPPPPNPSDSDLQQANDQVGQGLGRVGELINQVASAEQRLGEIAAEVAIKRESVNKALVDLQNARDVAEGATAAVGAARRDVSAATVAIDAAQKQFDEFAAASYRRGSDAGSLTAFLGSSGPDEILAKAELLRVIAQRHNAVMDGLQRARTGQANNDSSARAAKQAADAAAAVAEAKRTQAQDAIQAAVDAQQVAASRQVEIATERDSAQAQLDVARSGVAGLQNQRQVYDQWDTQRKAQEAAAAAAVTAAKQIALEAAARVAADRAARDRAAKVGAGQRPHTQLDDNPPGQPNDSSGNADNGAADQGGPDGADSGTSAEGSAPSADNGRDKPTGSAAIETVIDRAMSQLGVRYSWGGGNAKGPTLGIRDGGVADSYGDYKNVGFDCSGLMMYAFAGVGIALPHYSGYQYTAGTQIPTSQMKRGDLIFYGPNASEHEAMYLGDGQMLEAPESGDVVKVSPVRWGGIDPYVTRLL